MAQARHSMAQRHNVFVIGRMIPKVLMSHMGQATQTTVGTERDRTRILQLSQGMPRWVIDHGLSVSSSCYPEYHSAQRFRMLHNEDTVEMIED